MRKGKKAEIDAEKWLSKRGYSILYSHKGKASNLPYDIVVKKGKTTIVFDVKSGKRPSISLDNFIKLLTLKPKDIKSKKKINPINEVGYIFVVGKYFYLLTFNKKIYIARKAWAIKLKEGNKYWSQPHKIKIQR